MRRSASHLPASLLLAAFLGSSFTPASAQSPNPKLELTAEQRQVPLEQLPAETDAAALKAKVVLLAGTPSNKPGQHEYFAGCALLRDWLLAAAPEAVSPVMVAGGWPQNEAVLSGARCVVIYMDGGDKLSFLSPQRWERMKTLADQGTGFVILHQAIDCPPDRAATFKDWFGAAFQGDIGCRGHWDVNFEQFPAHAVSRGMSAFPLLKDGWLYNLHFAGSGVTPLLQCAMPDSSRKTADAKAHSGRLETVAWAYERPGARGGRSFGFTGCDLHSNWAETNQRTLLLNGILWTCDLEVPTAGLKAETDAAALASRWDRKVFLKKAAKAGK